MIRFLSSRITQAATASLLCFLLAFVLSARSIEHSNLVSLEWPSEEYPRPLNVRVFAIWRYGSADASPPHRIRIVAGIPDSKPLGTYVDPKTLECFETIGAGKGDPLGQLSPALLHDRIAPMTANLDETKLMAALANVDALIRRIATEGIVAMRLTSSNPTIEEEAGYAQPAELPHWRTYSRGPAERYYTLPFGFYMANAIALCGIVVPIILLIRPLRLGRAGDGHSTDGIPAASPE